MDSKSALLPKAPIMYESSTKSERPLLDAHAYSMRSVGLQGKGLAGKDYPTNKDIIGMGEEGTQSGSPNVGKGSANGELGRTGGLWIACFATKLQIYPLQFQNSQWRTSAVEHFKQSPIFWKLATHSMGSRNFHGTPAIYLW